MMLPPQTPYQTKSSTHLPIPSPTRINTPNLKAYETYLNNPKVYATHPSAFRRTRSPRSSISICCSGGSPSFPSSLRAARDPLLPTSVSSPDQAPGTCTSGSAAVLGKRGREWTSRRRSRLTWFQPRRAVSESTTRGSSPRG